MKFLILFILLELLLVINARPEIQNFFIDDNGDKCALLDLSADLTVNYNTINEKRTSTLNLFNATSDGHCSYKPSETQVKIEVKIPPSETLVFTFENISNWVVLKSIQFNYTTPNVNFPLAEKNGTFSGNIESNMTLSTTNKYFECDSNNEFPMSNGISLNTYYVKTQVFNVNNSSFGREKNECPKDFDNGTTTFSTTSSTKLTTLNASTSHTPLTTLTTHKTETTSTTPRETTSTTHTSLTTTTHHNITTSTTHTSGMTTAHNVTTSTTHTPGTTSTHNNVTSLHSTTITQRSSVISTTNSILSTTPNVPPTVFTFSVSNPKTKKICLVFKAEMKVNITYNTSNSETRIRTFDILSNATHSGQCLDLINSINIRWLSGLSVNFIFVKKNSDSSLNNITVRYTISRQYFPDYTNENKNESSSKSFDGELDMPVGNSYQCNANTFTIGNSVVALTNFQYQSFMDSDSDHFSGDETKCGIRNPIVAIIVGVVLAGFLIIVVVIFLIFRYKARRRRDYEEI